MTLFPSLCTDDFVFRIFLFQVISFKKYFNVSLGNNFLLFFVEAF